MVCLCFVEKFLVLGFEGKMWILDRLVDPWAFKNWLENIFRFFTGKQLHNSLKYLSLVLSSFLTVTYRLHVWNGGLQ